MGKVVDLSGQVINGLEIISLAYNNGRNYWGVLCVCGSPRKPMLSSEINRYKGACSCDKNITGQTLRYFEVGRYQYSLNHSKYYSCRCLSCDAILEAEAWRLLKGVDFCGCLKHEVIHKEDYLEVTVFCKNYSFTTLIDEEDYEVFSKSRWYLTASTTTNKLKYVSRKVPNTTKDSCALFHRIITEAPTELVVDHISGDTLDNRKRNLRLVSNTINCRNCKLSSNNTSGYTGVKLLDNGYYWAYIMVDRKQITLGRKFSSFQEAVDARKAAEKLYGFHENHGRTN